MLTPNETIDDNTNWQPQSLAVNTKSKMVANHCMEASIESYRIPKSTIFLNIEPSSNDFSPRSFSTMISWVKQTQQPKLLDSQLKQTCFSILKVWDRHGRSTCGCTNPFGRLVLKKMRLEYDA